MCAGQLQKLLTDLNHIVWKGINWTKEEVIKFWDLSRIPDPGSRIFFFNFSKLQDCSLTALAEV